MSCNCPQYQCISVDFNPCSNGVELPLSATETGDWIMYIEFNGTWQRLLIEVTDGEPIIIPNVLNEYYTHTIRLLDSNKDLFNDTCYKLLTNVTTETIAYESQSGKEIQPVLYITTSQAIAEYQDDLLIGAEIISIELEGLPFTSFTFDSTTGTITTPLLLPDGGTLAVLYKS